MLQMEGLLLPCVNGCRILAKLLILPAFLRMRFTLCSVSARMAAACWSTSASLRLWPARRLA